MFRLILWIVDSLVGIIRSWFWYNSGTIFLFSRYNETGIANFFEQFSVLLKMGYSYEDALTQIKKYSSILKVKITSILYDLKNGYSFGKAFQRSFWWSTPKLTRRFIEVAEQKGRLIEWIKIYVRYVGMKNVIRKKQKDLIRYPLLQILIFLIIIGVILIFVIPVFKNMYQDFGSQLPEMTDLIVNILESVKANGALLVSALLFSMVFLKKYFFKRLNDRIDTVLIMLLVKDMLSCGQTLSEGFAAAASILDKKIYKKAAKDLVENEINGIPIDRAIVKWHALPSELITAISSASIATDKEAILDHFLTSLHFYHEMHVAQYFKRLGIGLLLVNGVLIGLIVIAMYLPIFKIPATVGFAM